MGPFWTWLEPGSESLHGLMKKHMSNPQASSRTLVSFETLGLIAGRPGFAGWMEH